MNEFTPSNRQCETDFQEFPLEISEIAPSFDWHQSLDWLQSVLSPGEFQNLQKQLEDALSWKRHGDLKGWIDSALKLPPVSAPGNYFQDAVRFGSKNELSLDTSSQIQQAFEELIPWRKGPFDVYDTHIDTEWRSDWKWDRIAPHLNLTDKRVLDIGCGNGYHLWRMLGQSPLSLIGIDPSPRFIVQFYMLKYFYRGQIPIDVLPLKSEQMPQKALFDTVLSMGVLYHRKSPLEHLEEAYSLLLPGGDLLLETLTIEGDETAILLPADRYAMMRNVWFIPSDKALENMLARAGFENIRVLDTSVTSTQEQRQTDWMRFHSLEQFLDSSNDALTLEGYPRPRRSVMMAQKA